MDDVRQNSAKKAAAAPSRWRLFLTRPGLQGQLVLAFSVLLMLALGTTSWFFVAKSRDTLSDILGEQARQISQTLAMASTEAYRKNDRGELQHLGQTLLRSRNLVLVVFCDQEGKPLALACRDPDLTVAKWLASPYSQASTLQLMQVQPRHTPSLGDFLQITVPVIDVTRNASTGRETGTHMQGFLTVGISQNNELIQLKHVSAMGVLMGFLAFVVCLPLALGLIHRIFLPIRQLVTAANRIASGDYSAQVATHRPDEIGTLARSFNEMARRIHQHQEDLKVANECLAEANRDLERKVSQRTAELESTNQRLSAEIAEKEDFLRAVSHDLNAPLRNIGGMASTLLVRHREQFDEDVIHRLERINKNVKVETDLITELLELSRLKTRRQKMEQIDVDVLVRELSDVFDDDLKRRGISLVIEDKLPVLICERLRIRQVFQNLIDNAIKYMGQSPVREIRIGCRTTEQAFEFHVRDAGIGIHPDDVQKIFYVFRRGRNSADINVAGKGVGLSSVKSIIAMYDGRIWVESDLGKGSTFHFTIHRKFAPDWHGPVVEEPDAEAA